MRIKIWIILIALLTAFAGETEIGSPLISVSENPSGRQVLSQRAMAVNEEFCTTEMLGIHGSIEECRLTERYGNRRGEERITLFVLSVFVLLKLAGLFLGSAEPIPVRSHSSEELITIYMHKSDGKKRI